MAGDDDAIEALPERRRRDAKIARSLKQGETPTEDPLDPVLAALLAVLRGGGAIAPTSELLTDRSTWALLIPLGGVSGPTSGADGEEFADLVALTRARKALFEWDWDRSQSLARDGLRGARREAVRDELLNIVACSLWLQGDHERALAALDRALEGDYSDALLTNAAVVASELEHRIAIDRFVKIAREAPGPHQRAMAAERALMLWVTDEDRIWDDDRETLPEEILSTLRSLISELIPDERYIRIIRTLATHDDEWLASQPEAAFGAHATTAPVRIFRARAQGLEDFAAALARELGNGGAEKWVEEERDSVVTAAIDILVNRGGEMSAAFFGMTLIQAEIPMEPLQRVSLNCLTVASITQSIDTDVAEPKDECIDWVNWARTEFPKLSEDHREVAAPLIQIAGEALARTYGRARAAQLAQAREVFEKVEGQLRAMYSHQINHEAVQEIMTPISALCHDSWTVLNKVRALISDRDLLEAIDGIMALASDLGNKAVRIR